MSDRYAEILPGIHVRQAAPRPAPIGNLRGRGIGWVSEWSEPYDVGGGEMVRSRWFQLGAEADEALNIIAMGDRGSFTLYRALWCGQTWRIDRREHA